MPKLSDRPASPPKDAEPDDPDDELDEPDPSADDQPTKKAAAKKKAPAKKAPAKKAAARASSSEDDEPDLASMDLLGGAESLADTADYTNILWYGREGTGKTTHAVSMVDAVPPGIPIYVINAEAGLKRQALIRRGIDVSRIMVLPNTAAGQTLTFEFLEELFWQAKARLEANPGCIGGFVFDSITEIHQVLINNIVASEVARAEQLGRDRDRFFRTQDNYGVMASQLTELLRRYRDLPCHFAMTALERRDVDDDGKVKYGPAVTPALQTVMGGLPDMVGHTYVDEVGGVEQYLAKFRPSGKYSGKDRYGALPPQLIDPTFVRVHGYVNGLIDPDDDPVMAEAIAHRRRNKGKGVRAEAADDGTSSADSTESPDDGNDED